MELEMYAYRRYAAVAGYRGDDKYVVIPRTYNGVPVTEIKEGAFANTAVEEVFIPPSLQTIGANAFANCQKLHYVGCDIRIDTLAKKNAERSICVFPPCLQTVEACAFKNTALEKVEFNAEAVEIGDSAFEDCKMLEIVTVYGSERVILGKRIFMNSSIERFYAPNVRFDPIPDYAFANCINLESVITKINAVGIRSFYRCGKLKKLFTSKVLRQIGSEAFTGCDQLEEYGKPGKKAAASNRNKKAAKTAPAPPKRIVDPALQKNRMRLLWILSQIEENVKAKEEMDVYIWNKGGDVSVSGEPLFCISVEYAGIPPRKLHSDIKGEWKKNSLGYFFNVQIPSACASVGLKMEMGKVPSHIIPLLDYVANRHMETILSGRHEGNRYVVYDMYPVVNNTYKAVSRGFFLELVDRIKRPVPKGMETGAGEQPFLMRTEEEFRIFAEICGPRLPRWLLDAYQKNMDEAKQFCDDDKRHALRALEVLMNVDWLPHAVNVPPVDEVRRFLDHAFFGHEKVKERIEEVAAQIRRTGTLPKWGILLHGPAGTGKTSIAKAIAYILGMALIQMDMSTEGRENETISGSSRIFHNARPGKLAEEMLRIRSSTAVLLVNEVEKAAGKKGGGSAADVLLTILDKTGFYENFLEEVIPTDHLFCIGTCNDLKKISKPLLDRFLIIDVPAYNAAEKKAIFNDYVFPAALEGANIRKDQICIAQDAVELLVSEYALEPGARDLEQYSERFVGDYCRSVAGDLLQAKRIYTVEDIRELFGPSRSIVRKVANNPGEAMAAYYHDGMASLFLLEAAVVPGSGKFEVLGPLGMNQKEYCKAAYWCVRNTANAFSCDLSCYDVTIFVPHAIPDSTANFVGLACYAAICSRLLNRKLELGDSCFVGGCDLNGSLYFDENNLTPLFRAMKAGGLSTLYAPMGTNRLVDAKTHGDCNVTVIEAVDAANLFTMALTQTYYD